MKASKENIYEAKFVEALFDEMSGSYSRMNYITSFGFSERWRRQCVREIGIQQGKTTVDLMTGMGECWKYILKKSNKDSQLIALDFSSEMIKNANAKKRKLNNEQIEILKENVFKNSIQTNSVDYVISGFGLKTFNATQLNNLADEIHRILKTGGEFSLIDVSVPQNKTLRSFYMFYLKNVIPILGKLFLGNPESYRMLGVYTENFQNSKQVFEIFNSKEFELEYVEYFFGCASGIKGRKLQ